MTAMKSVMRQVHAWVHDRAGRHLDRGRARRIVLLALPLVAAVATVFVAIVSSAVETDRSDDHLDPDADAIASVQAYADEMSAWWSTVLDGAGFIDHALLRTPQDVGTLPRVRPVVGLEAMHGAIEANLSAVLQARLNASDAGLLHGIAAGYCDPKRYGREGVAFAPEIRGLQLWERDGGDCASSARWEPGGSYVVPCGEEAALRSWGVEFDVDTGELLEACASQRLTAQAWVDIQQAWIRALITSCGQPASDEALMSLTPHAAIARCLGQ